MSIGIHKGQRRFFAMTDTKRIPLIHRGYGPQVQSYFRNLFPHREWKVFSDSIGNPLPVDVEMLYPTIEEPFYLLHTIGMSAVPMHYPAGELPRGKETYSELCMILPADWPFGKKRNISLDDSRAWPIWLLMELGRFPHMHQIWMSYGFALPNTEACEPFSPTTDLSGVIIVQFEGDLGELQMEDGTNIELLMPILIYKEEMELVDEIGIDELVEKILDHNGGSFLLDINRVNVARRIISKKIL